MHSHTAAWPRIGKRVPASFRVVARGRWFEIHPGRVVEVGWGDLTFTDLVGLQATVGDVVVVVLPERQRPPTARELVAERTEPSLDELVEEASIAVTAELGAVAVCESTPILASIDRASLRAAALVVYEGGRFE